MKQLFACYRPTLAAGIATRAAVKAKKKTILTIRSAEGDGVWVRQIDADGNPTDESAQADLAGTVNLIIIESPLLFFINAKN